MNIQFHLNGFIEKGLKTELIWPLLNLIWPANIFNQPKDNNEEFPENIRDLLLGGMIGSRPLFTENSWLNMHWSSLQS